MEGATQLSEGSVHRAGGGIPHVREYVRVDVEREADVRVAWKLMNILGIDALTREERGARSAAGKEAAQEALHGLSDAQPVISRLLGGPAPAEKAAFGGKESGGERAA